MKVLDLFSGIGGFSLGLERAGMQTVAFCEIDPFARRVLKKHWPETPICDDVRTMRGTEYGAIDVVCGGFPCTDISRAGKMAGLAGSRSGLWGEMRRIIGEARLDTCSSKTSPDSALTDFTRCSQTLARSGSMRSGLHTRLCRWFASSAG